MSALLACLPVLMAAGLILARLGPVWASAGAFAACLVVAVTRFPTPLAALAASGSDFAPLVLEVLLILLFGMVLAQLLRAAGAIAVISRFVESCAPSPAAGAVLVVFGIVPFAESVTGFGIGVTVGVPILVAIGFTPVRAALLGVCGLVAVPWGALGPGTAVAANLGGVGLGALGVATAWVNAVPIVVVAVTVCLAVRGSAKPAGGASAHRVGTGARIPGAAGGEGRHLAGTAVYALVAAAALFGTILLTNILVGTPVAGVVGSAVTAGLLLLVFRLRGARFLAPAGLGSALVPYAVLTAGLIVCQVLALLVPHPLTGLLATPPVWLAVAVGLAGVAVHRGAGDPGRVTLAAMRAWAPVGVSTGLFMAVGWLMTATGMSAAIGGALAAVGVASTPLLMGLAAVLTGSNTGANSMFSGTLAQVAVGTGAPVLSALGIGNAAASFGTLATPSRIAMAVTLAAPEAPGGAHRALERRVQVRALLVVLAAEAALTIVALLG